MKYKTIIIGIDQSYTRTGISVAADGKLLKVSSIAFKGCHCNTEKRKQLEMILFKLLTKARQEASSVAIICERIRTFTGGFGKANQLRPKYLISTGALIATIVDTAFDFGIKVYSVDTRSWKSRIVGTSKPIGDSEYSKKLPTLNYVKKLGFDMCLGENKNGKIKYDDDAADSACIALYGFLPKSKRNLNAES